ncbi:hypothetical protein GCM10011352_03220 [Marinobacterium zhoushanense]|uniref:Uncharacterized protein n=1 Tax=Marinobacterium zhoushanense TaxID=1679163 RepID=A0ABQ1K267_9GAMM|nr:hypothetical protein [Marinobacterium zhoushanense]GGB80869.1 hypothetical protein GCM10011352_03220 [Marinobacterium zhoushanense]
MDRDWTAEAKRLFAVDKPAHFTNFQHCCECAEHDETLRMHTVDSIGLAQLGSPAWDPLCFCSAEGLQYYLPAMIRLSLKTITDESYFDQMLFHLAVGGPDNRLRNSCSVEQKAFVVEFLAHMITTYPKELDRNFTADDALSAYELWGSV